MTEKSDPHNQEASDSGSGSYSILGYEYQVEVSVWLALDLVLSKQYSDHLVLEPASEEDIEADVVDRDVGTVTSTTSIDTYRLIVQSKRQSGDAWGVNDIRRLLKHGVRRESASKRLEKLEARYLLVTSAGANGGVRKLAMKDLVNWPDEELPVSIREALPPDCRGRVAVFANMDEERLRWRIRDLLTVVGNVPTTQFDKCLRVLREEARARVMGAGEGRWTREQLVEIVRRHEGYVASSHDVEIYVKPSNWADIVDKMESKSAAVLIGQSGTGKTTTTKALYAELRSKYAGLNRVPIQGTRDIGSDTTPAPVLYDIEDPWGKFDFEPQRRDWNQEITKVLAEATPRRMVVVTTRRDVALSAGVLDAIKPWAVALEAESYGPEQRVRMYQSRIPSLPRNLHMLASDAESQVLSSLKTPLEIQKFFDALSHGPESEKSKHSRVTDAISKAHEESIERTVREQVGQRGDLAAATVLWGLLKASEKISFGFITEVQDKLSDRSNQEAPKLTSFVEFFVAARNFRQVDSSVSYYHPRVEAGVQRLLKENRLEVRKAVSRLLDVLTLSVKDADRGVAMAALILQAERNALDFDTSLSEPAIARIDGWLNEQLMKGGAELEKRIELAAVVGSEGNNLAEFARFLRHRPDQTFPGFSYWHLPSRDPAWYARMKADPAVRRLAELFVEDVLWATRDSFNEKFVDAMEDVAPSLSRSFLKAALRIVPYGYQDNINVIASGALVDLDGYEVLVDAAVEELRKIDAPSPARDAEVMNIVNEVYGDEYADWSSQNDDGYTATEFVKIYVERQRAEGAWTVLATHRHRAELVGQWALALNGDSSTSVEELKGAFELARGTSSEGTLWGCLTYENYRDFRSMLINRLLDGSTPPDVWRDAFKTLVSVSPEDLAEVVARFDYGEVSSRPVDIAVELGRLRARPQKDELPAVYMGQEVAFRGLTPALQEIAIASFSLDLKDVPALTPETAQWLSHAAGPSEEVRLFRLLMAKHMSLDVQDDVRWVLNNSEDADSCELAMDVAVLKAMTDEVEAGLEHRYAKVVAISLREAAKAFGAPLPRHLLKLVHSEPSPIRRALAQMLVLMHHDDHLDTLLVLAGDRWSRAMLSHRDDANFPIAQLAIEGLLKRDHLDLVAAERLLEIAKKTPDPDLQFDIFDLLVQRAGKQIQKRLVRGTLKSRQRAASSCARALLGNHESVEPDVLGAITVEALSTTHEAVSVRLLTLVGLKSPPEFVLSMARALAADVNKKVLLLPLIWALSQLRSDDLGEIVSLLPVGHPAVALVTSGETDGLNSKMLEDIGDARNISAVVSFLNPASNKPKLDL